MQYEKETDLSITPPHQARSCCQRGNAKAGQCSSSFRSWLATIRKLPGQIACHRNLRSMIQYVSQHAITRNTLLLKGSCRQS